MATPIIMPKFEMAQETGTIMRWVKQNGDEILRGEPIMEVETDKVVMDVEAPEDGILAGATAAEGDVIPVATVIAYVLQPGEELPADSAAPAADQPAAAEPASAQQAATASDLKATPVARRRAAAAGIDIAAVPAPGEGKVTREHVEAYLSGQNGRPATAAPRPYATPAARRVAAEAGLDLAAISGSGPDGRVQELDVIHAAETAQAPAQPVAPVPATAPQTGARVPLQGMRRTIATRLLDSYQSIPHVMFTVTADMSAMQAERVALNADAAAEGLPKVSMTALLVKVIAWALGRHPLVNASLFDDGIEYHDAINVGMAVALDDGLIVPVIHNADTLGIQDIAAQVGELTSKARAGTLGLADVQGGTFTISNLGMLGIDQFTAIINPPQSAILAVGRTVKEPVVIETGAGDEVVIRPQMKMTLSVDHRIIDGAVAAQFLQDVVRGLERPSRLLW